MPMKASLNGTGRDCDPAYCGASRHADDMENQGWYQKRPKLSNIHKPILH
jgi:hypothetical protein